MPTVKYKNDCALCGQPVEIDGFSLTKERTVLSFCCAGCQSIYALIYGKVSGANEGADESTDDTITTKNTNEDN